MSKARKENKEKRGEKREPAPGAKSKEEEREARTRASSSSLLFPHCCPAERAADNQKTVRSLSTLRFFRGKNITLSLSYLFDHHAC